MITLQVPRSLALVGDDAGCQSHFAAGPWATAGTFVRAPRYAGYLQLHCVTRVGPVECGAILWRAFRCNVAVGLVGGECDLHIVCREPRIVCDFVLWS